MIFSLSDLQKQRPITHQTSRSKINTIQNHNNSTYHYTFAKKHNSWISNTKINFILKQPLLSQHQDQYAILFDIKIRIDNNFTFIPNDLIQNVIQVKKIKAIIQEDTFLTISYFDGKERLSLNVSFDTEILAIEWQKKLRQNIQKAKKIKLKNQAKQQKIKNLTSQNSALQQKLQTSSSQNQKLLKQLHDLSTYISYSKQSQQKFLKENEQLKRQIRSLYNFSTTSQTSLPYHKKQKTLEVREKQNAIKKQNQNIVSLELRNSAKDLQLKRMKEIIEKYQKEKEERDKQQYIKK